MEMRRSIKRATALCQRERQQSESRQPVNATGNAGSDSSGRTFQAFRDVVRNRNENRQETGEGGWVVN
jgi:hypothetical protein